MIIAVWILPILISIPTHLEAGVEFEPGPGNGTGWGHICYSKVNGTIVVLTTTQHTVSMISDIVILLIILASSIVTWFRFKKTVERGKETLKNNEFKLIAFSITAKLEEKYISIAISVICAYYVIVRFPLYIVSHVHSGHDYTQEQHDGIFKGIGVCIILYIMQFCTHFLIYAVIQSAYRKAYCSVLKLVFPCCFKCKKSEDNQNVGIEEKELPIS